MIQQYKEKVMEWIFKGKRHKAAANNYSNKAKMDKQVEIVKVVNNEIFVREVMNG